MEFNPLDFSNEFFTSYQNFLSDLSKCKSTSNLNDVYEIERKIILLKATFDSQMIQQWNWFNQSVLNLTCKTLEKNDKSLEVVKRIERLWYRTPTAQPFISHYDSHSNSSVTNVPNQPSYSIPIGAYFAKACEREMDLPQEPQTWIEWIQQSDKNKLGYVIRYYSNPKVIYPLERVDANDLDAFINHLFIDRNESNCFSSCKDFLFKTFQSLLLVKTQHEAKIIIANLIYREPLRSIILDDIKTTINPIMRYLHGLDTLSPTQVIIKVRKFREALRRWGFIEKDNKFGGQSDPVECLQSLFDFLQTEEDLKNPKQELVWKAILNENETQWGIVNVDLEQENEKTKRILNKLLNSSKGFGALDPQERDDFPPIEQVLKPHVEKHPLPFCIQTVIKDGVLLPGNSLDAILPRIFKEIDYFFGYQIKERRINEQLNERRIQKVAIPVQKISTQFNGTPPPVLVLQNMPIFENRYEMDLPDSKIPQRISFAGSIYYLAKCSMKSGNQNCGHYTFWTLNFEGKSQYANSIEEDDLIVDNNPLSNVISGKKNVALLEYQRSDVNPSEYIIRHKLYQSSCDNLCYVIQALYFIFGNASFSSINQINPYRSSFVPEEKIEATRDPIGINLEEYCNSASTGRLQEMQFTQFSIEEALGSKKRKAKQDLKKGSSEKKLKPNHSHNILN